MTTPIGRTMLIGDLQNFVMQAPVRAPADPLIASTGTLNTDLFTHGHDVFVRQLEDAGLKAPIAVDYLHDIELEAGHNWNRVRTPENQVGIARRVRFLTGVPFKVGIWMDESGRFTDLRFGHWGIHAQHIGSSIYRKAHAVALLMPHDDGVIPMEVYFLDISARVRNAIGAWMWNYNDAHRWYANLDKHFKIHPFLIGLMDRYKHQRTGIAQSNAAHFDALRAPLLRLPSEGFRKLPGNLEGLTAANLADDGGKRIFMKRRDEDSAAPYVKHLNALRFSQRQGDKPLSYRASKNAALIEVGLGMYVKRLRQKKLQMPGETSALEMLMADVEKTWAKESPETLEDIRTLVEFVAGVPLKAGFWFHVDDSLLGLRFGHWGGHMLHLGHAINGEADAVVSLMPTKDGFIPMRAMLTTPLARHATSELLAYYDDVQEHYRDLDERFGIRSFIDARMKEYRLMNARCAIAGICHAQEIKAPLLGFAEGADSAFLPSSGSTQVIVRGEHGSWAVGVPKDGRIKLDKAPHGPGIYEVPSGTRLTHSGRVLGLGHRLGYIGPAYLESSER